MVTSDSLVLLATGAFFLGGVALVVIAPRIRVSSPTPSRLRRNAALEMPCSVCRKPLIIESRDLRPLIGEEVGLVVRSVPGVVGRRLSEYVCPYCESAHCFITDERRPRWIGANFSQPQTKTAHCFECRKALRTPPWPEHAYDGRLKDAPGLHPDHGLVCSRCQSICCVDCCTRATKGRLPQGEYLCPRCFRGPLDAVFHP